MRDEGAAIVELIETGIRYRGQELPPVSAPPSRLRGRRYTPLREILLTLFYVYPRRTLVAFSLMASQAFFYNAIFFTYALILTEFFNIPSGQVGWYILPFAAGNFCGPLALGWAFDTLGRRPMIALTYALSGVLLAGSGALFALDAITATQQTALWMVIFFFASAAASSAYLTVSEIFPLEIRAIAIAVFFAIGTGVGGALTPWLFGALIDTHSRISVFIGYLLGSDPDDRRRDHRMVLGGRRGAEKSWKALHVHLASRIEPARIVVMGIRVAARSSCCVAPTTRSKRSIWVILD